jgi:hypothetical protein
MAPDRIRRRANFWFGFTLVVTLLIVTAHLSKMAHFMRFLSFDVRQDVFPSLLVCCVVLLIPMTIRLVLLWAEKEGKLPQLLHLFAKRGILGTISDIARMPAMRFLLWGTGIVILLAVPISQHALFVENATLVMLGSDLVDQQVYSEVPVRTLWMFTRGQGLEGRLERLVRVCRDLKSAGAKVVLLESPTSWLTAGAEVRFMKEIQKTGVAVVGFRANYLPGNAWYAPSLFSPTPEYTDSIGLEKGVLSLRTLSEPYMQTKTPIALLAPWRHISGFGSHDTIPDVIFEVLRKFHNYPATLKPRVTSSAAEFGDYSVPVNSEGTAVFINAWWGGRALPFDASDHWSTGNFAYHSTRGADTTEYPGLERFSSEVKGMIVMIAAYDPLDAPFPSWGGVQHYAGILQQILQRTVPRYVDRFALPATIAAVLVSVLLAFFLRIRVAVPVMLGLALLLLGIGIAFFQLSNVILEVIYPAIAFCICTLTMPLVKISAEAYVARQIK